MIDKLILSEPDKASYLWQRLMKHWQARLEQLRTQLEGNKTDIETAALRGRIAEMRAVMALNDPPAAPE